MGRTVSVRNADRPDGALVRAEWCQSFACRLRGLMFRRSLPPDRGLLLVEQSEGRANTSIHMAFVFFPLAVFWLDAQQRVVDRRIARPWTVHVPSAPARFVLEIGVEVAGLAEVGDRLEFLDEMAPR